MITKIISNTLTNFQVNSIIKVTKANAVQLNIFYYFKYMNDSLLSKQNVKFGLTFGIPAGVLTVLSFIPCLGWVLNIIGWMIVFLGGYVVVMIKGGSKERMADAFRNAFMMSLIPALVVGLANALAGVIGVLFFFPRVAFLDIGPAFGDYFFSGGVGFVSAFIWVILFFILGSFLAVYYPETKLPTGLRDILNKFKSMAVSA